ncbi:hypothetical protein FOVG_19237 [Fusarium oxysporum f. sp. pisi HDV247]|uniref:Uncharacterized protein n=1 Tax=Fusarium oxysporum f. sp. pisi HDV247 TaxID=1080344 RepID=W9N912_FUSOX|nr:hypothetical protein FOVG_19237 [Fusarium oxysporum f. sp. pisi HDV247]
MSRCRHTCWLKPWSLGIETGLEVTDRPQRLLKEFENPDAESAGLLVLIGNQSKQAAFKKLSFQTGRIRARAGGEIHLLVSSLKENRRKRIVIADTDASGSQAKLPNKFLKMDSTMKNFYVELYFHLLTLYAYSSMI